MHIRSHLHSEYRFWTISYALLGPVSQMSLSRGQRLILGINVDFVCLEWLPSDYQALYLILVQVLLGGYISSMILNPLEEYKALHTPLH